jgi:hypothetical protein
MSIEEGGVQDVSRNLLNRVNNDVQAAESDQKDVAVDGEDQ